MMTMTRAYDLADADARERMRALADYWSTKHGLRVEWQGESSLRVSGRVKGVSFEGTVAIAEGALTANVEAGWLAEKLGGRGYVERKLDDYLDPKKTVAELRARIPK